MSGVSFIEHMRKNVCSTVARFVLKNWVLGDQVCAEVQFR